jgi:hypothetical protein
MHEDVDLLKSVSCFTCLRMWIFDKNVGQHVIKFRVSLERFLHADIPAGA